MSNFALLLFSAVDKRSIVVHGCAIMFLFALMWILMIHFQHKVLLQLFNTSDDRAQKRQPIRGSDEGELLLCKVFLSHWNLQWICLSPKKWSKNKQKYLPTVLKPDLKQTLFAFASPTLSIVDLKCSWSFPLDTYAIKHSASSEKDVKTFKIGNEQNRWEPVQTVSMQVMAMQ